MTDEEVIKRRLLIDGDGTGDDRRLNTLIKGIIKWSKSNGLSKADNERMHDRLTAQLAQCAFPARRARTQNKTNTKQLEAYEELQTDIVQTIANVKQTIKESKAKLEGAKILKGNRMQYDLLAQRILAQPARAVTEKKLSTLKTELEALKEEKKSFEENIDRRRKQFTVLTSSANQLKALLGEALTDDSINTSLDDITNSPGPEPMSE